MSKKKKHNLQKLIAKKQQLQQITQGKVVVFGESAEIESYQETVHTVVTSTKYQPKITTDRALRKTALSIVVITILLVTIIIFDQKSPYLNRFGDWIYSALRLQS